MLILEEINIICWYKLLSNSIFYDNQSTISMSKNPVFYGRSKHIELRHNYIPDMVQKKEICLEYIKNAKQPADVLTKLKQYPLRSLNSSKTL